MYILMMSGYLYSTLSIRRAEQKKLDIIFKLSQKCNDCIDINNALENIYVEFQSTESLLKKINLCKKHNYIMNKIVIIYLTPGKSMCVDNECIFDQDSLLDNTFPLLNLLEDCELVDNSATNVNDVGALALANTDNSATNVNDVGALANTDNSAANVNDADNLVNVDNLVNNVSALVNVDNLQAKAESDLIDDKIEQLDNIKYEYLIYSYDNSHNKIIKKSNAVNFYIILIIIVITFILGIIFSEFYNGRIYCDNQHCNYHSYRSYCN